MRLARDCGNISSLFPEGVTRLCDLPHTIHTAIRMALHFLKFEEMPEEEDRPPKHIWLDADRMDQWWKEVKAAHESRNKGEPALRDMDKNKAMEDIFPGVKFD